LNKKYHEKGLVIIGPESQGHSSAQIQQIVNKHKLPYTVTTGSTRPFLPRSIPYALVFDASGTLIYSGSPDDRKFDRSISKAIKELEGRGGIPKSENKTDSTHAKEKVIIPKRSWTNSEGKRIIASVTDISPTSVVFKLTNGKTVRYAIDKLSEEDQKIIQNARSQIK